MYNTFECHFKPNQKLQSDMTDPVQLKTKLYNQKPFYEAKC